MTAAALEQGAARFVLPLTPAPEILRIDGVSNSAQVSLPGQQAMASGSSSDKENDKGSSSGLKRAFWSITSFPQYILSKITPNKRACPAAAPLQPDRGSATNVQAEPRHHYAAAAPARSHLAPPGSTASQVQPRMQAPAPPAQPPPFSQVFQGLKDSFGLQHLQQRPAHPVPGHAALQLEHGVAPRGPPGGLSQADAGGGGGPAVHVLHADLPLNVLPASTLKPRALEPSLGAAPLQPTTSGPGLLDFGLPFAQAGLSRTRAAGGGSQAPGSSRWPVPSRGHGHQPPPAALLQPTYSKRTSGHPAYAPAPLPQQSASAMVSRLTVPGVPCPLHPPPGTCRPADLR